MDNLTIETEVLPFFKDFIEAEAFDKQVKEKAAYILERTKDNYYCYKSLMLWVAEETKSVVASDLETLTFKFSFVGC